MANGTWFFALTTLLLSTFSTTIYAAEKAEPITCILGAMPSEAKLVRQTMTDKQVHKHLDIEFVTGELRGRRVVLAVTGVGKVNAAMTTTLLLDHFAPSEVLFTGIAGGLDPQLKPGDLVIGTRLAQHDLGMLNDQGILARGMRNPVSGKRNPVYFASDPSLVKQAEQAASKIKFDKIGSDEQARTPRIVKGTILTGDAFLASRTIGAELRRKHDASAVEMEGAAVAQICHQQSVPFLVVRSLSDSADDNAMRDVQQFYRTAAKNSAALTMSLVADLANKRPVPAK